MIRIFRIPRQKGFDGPVDLFVGQDFLPWSKGKPGPNNSSGMQYWQRRLQRSVIEMRKSLSGRLSESITAVIPVGLFFLRNHNQSGRAIRLCRLNMPRISKSGRFP